MKSMIVKLSLALAACLATSANAALVKSNDVILDTATGLEWLNVRLPNGLSYQQVQSGVGGWTLDGWRYASFDELSSLANRYIGASNGGYSSATESALSTSYASSADLFVQAFGMNLAFNDPRALYNINTYPGLRQISVQGFFMDRNSSNPRLGTFEVTAVLEDTYGTYGPIDQFVPFGRWGLFEDFLEPYRSGPNISSLLVRGTATEVPEPTPLLLAGVGLVALVFQRRKRGTTPIPQAS
ncbi:MAG: PEP-CTERM sorting domain-containing protein [Polaromonas sp.]|nr:PEP-CTERM sorting domain-containing protein [Polaromonas sp.]